MDGALGQFSFQAVQLFFEADQFLLVSGENLFLERLAFDSPQGADLLMLLAIPIDQSALGDFEVFSDAAQAPAFGPSSMNRLLVSASYITVLFLFS